MNQKQKYIDIPEGNEFDILSEQLDSEEISILTYLKGFNRKNMKQWQQLGIGNFSTESFNN